VKARRPPLHKRANSVNRKASARQGNRVKELSDKAEKC